MKSFLLHLILLLITTCLSAQLVKNAKFVGFNMNYYKQKSTQDFAPVNSILPLDQSYRRLSITPTFGWSLNAKSMIYIGINANLEKRLVQWESFDEFTRVLEARYELEKEDVYSLHVGYEHFIKIFEKIYFIPRLTIGYGLGKSRYDVDNSFTKDKMKNDLKLFTIGITPGLQYFIDQKWAITGSMGNISYQRKIEVFEPDSNNTFKNKDENKTAYFGLNSFQLGIRYYLGVSIDNN